MDVAAEHWRGRNVLITGVTGFIGSALAERLVKRGAIVSGLANDFKCVRRDSVVSSVRIMFGDVYDYEKMCELISSNEVDTIFHLAAYSIVRVAAHDPLSTYRVNVMGTAALLEAARNVGKVRQIIVASSDKAYGDHETLPYVESHPLQPRNTYDTSKACMDMIARTYATNYGMPVCVTRCSNVYGPGDRNLSRIVPNTIRRVLSGKCPQLYSDVETMEREFIFIDDVIDALEMLGSADPQDTREEAYNIGGTGPIKIRDFVEMIAKEADQNFCGEIEIVERDEVFREIRKQYIDASKLMCGFGWRPKTDVKVGLKKTVAWYLADTLDDLMKEAIRRSQARRLG